MDKTPSSNVALLTVPMEKIDMDHFKLNSQYEWIGSENPSDPSGTVKFIMGGLFGRELKLESIEDCQYIADLLEISYKTGYVNGKDRIKHRISQLMNE